MGSPCVNDRLSWRKTGRLAVGARKEGGVLMRERAARRRRRRQVDELLFEHVVASRYHPSVVAESLPGFLTTSSPQLGRGTGRPSPKADRRAGAKWTERGRRDGEIVVYIPVGGYSATAGHRAWFRDRG